MEIATLNMSFYMSNLDMYTIDAIRKGIRTATTRCYPNEINLIKSLVPGQPIRFIRTDRNNQILDSIIVFADNSTNLLKDEYISTLSLDKQQKAANAVGYELKQDFIYINNLLNTWWELEGWDVDFAKRYFKLSDNKQEFWQFTYSLYPPYYDYSPEIITELKEKELFVFGSNTEGRHGAGAAKQAMKFGAVYGRPQGQQGDSYAIITTDLTKNYRPSVDLEVVKEGVNEFLQDAANNPHLTFLVTEIGCGLAGFTVEQIAPLFKPVLLKKISNVKVPKSFVRHIIVSSIEALL